MDKEKDRITRLLDNQLIKVFDPINAEYVEGYITGKSAEDLAEIILPLRETIINVEKVWNYDPAYKDEYNHKESL